jgi:alpha-L-fucosidase
MGVLVFNSCSTNTVTIPIETTKKVEPTDSKEEIILKAAHIIPTENQLAALKNEFTAFIHFGPNTFTRMEWGNGIEDPSIFNLESLDTDQWCESLKSAGITMVILTVKHHDGFVLWQSRYTKQGVMSSPFKDGKGDILQELIESLKKYDLKLGIYLSPADLFQIESENGLYGNGSEVTERTIPTPVEGRPFSNKQTFTFKVDDYNEYFLNQLFELLTEYGEVHEVWFDGANPKQKGNQQYNYFAWRALIRTLAPKAVIFGKEDIRWCGNESGKTRVSEWNIIPFQEDPMQLNSFSDITNSDIGSREKLYDAKYLHYQATEINTSIREGWFYRDETYQKVRSADDVFDIYERSVGGNSIFLLNIPPNREGKFSPEDVRVLNEVGKRINETYKTNLFENADGPKNLLDGDYNSEYELKNNNEIVITTKQPVTINRLVLQEAIATHSERIEKHAVDAWVNNDWTQISEATNIGYKRILRFPIITSNKFRVRVLETRFTPALVSISAHYYKTQPPQLSISRSFDGALEIQPKKQDFAWKPHGIDVAKNLNTNFEIRYTTDGTTPTKESLVYKEGVVLNSGEVKAIAIDNNQLGSVASKVFGILKANINVLEVSSSEEKQQPIMAIDENASTFWQSKPTGKTHFISFDLGAKVVLKGFSYTPQTLNSEGMIESGTIKISDNGKTWETLENFEFGNLINDPTTREHYFKTPITTQYIKVETRSIAANKKTAAIAEIDFIKE